MVDKIKKNPVQTLLIGAVISFFGQLISYTNGLEKLAWIFFILMCACIFIMIAISLPFREKREKEKKDEDMEA